MNFWLARAKEPSTWRGALMLLTGFGVAVSPENMESIVTAGTGIAGIVGMISKG